jgi:hypothetical protein
MLDNKSLTEELRRKPFPCPLCKRDLPLALSVKGKPYCVCNECGIQVFFRGLAVIKRLQIALRKKSPMDENFLGAPDIVALYNRLESLREDKGTLEQKQGLVFRDKALDHAIAAIDGDIQRLEIEIKKEGSGA